MSERVGKKILIILTNNFVYSGLVLSEDNFFIKIQDRKNGEHISIGKKDIQIIKEIEK